MKELRCRGVTHVAWLTYVADRVLRPGFSGPSSVLVTIGGQWVVNVWEVLPQSLPGAGQRAGSWPRRPRETLAFKGSNESFLTSRGKCVYFHRGGDCWIIREVKIRQPPTLEGNVFASWQASNPILEVLG